MKDLTAYLTEVIENIREDREVTKELLSDIMQYMSQDQHSHKEVGQTAAKYVETLQRSNEQFVKVSAIIHKRESSATHMGLSDKDKDDLFDIIKDNE
jgi:acetyl-CoA acetyltransferase|tara:strand:- start:375 stop:665 length:291 start_codon:yes stop_codon:yes gene_type:complete